MKTAHIGKGLDKKKLVPWMEETRDLERKNKEQAIIEYKQIIAAYPLTEDAFDRLMILYRQTKQPKEELSCINRAITVFEKSFGKPGKHFRGKIAVLSNSILKATGLIDTEGKPVYQPAPVSRWQKRKELLIKKTNK